MALAIRTSQRLPWWQDLSLVRPVLLLWQQRHLVHQLIRREINGRYRGSLLGIIWMALLPILAVVVYTLVFGLILKQRWPGVEANEWTYPLLIWSGLALFNAFAEVVQRATTVVVAQPNLVKKVVFPLDVLPVVLVGASLVPLLLSMLCVLAGIAICQGTIPNVLIIFAAILFFAIWLQGIAWFLAGVGTFLRDLGPMVQAICPLVLFLTPIFYPISVVPQQYQVWFWLNPLCVIVELVRAALLHTPMPPLPAQLGLLAMSWFTWQLGALVFTRLRPEMADVV